MPIDNLLAHKDMIKEEVLATRAMALFSNRDLEEISRLFYGAGAKAARLRHMEGIDSNSSVYTGMLFSLMQMSGVSAGKGGLLFIVAHAAKSIAEDPKMTPDDLQKALTYAAGLTSSSKELPWLREPGLWDKVTSAVSGADWGSVTDWLVDMGVGLLFGEKAGLASAAYRVITGSNGGGKSDSPFKLVAPTGTKAALPPKATAAIPMITAGSGSSGTGDNDDMEIE